MAEQAPRFDDGWRRRMRAQKLPPFPVDDETLNVVRDSLDRVVTGLDEDDNHIYSGSPFGLDQVLNMLSGYDPSLLVPMANDADLPIPDTERNSLPPGDWYVYIGGPIYSPQDVMRALIDEVRRLRVASASVDPDATEETNG